VTVVVVALLVIGAFVVWRIINDHVLPTVQEATDQFSTFSDVPPGPCYDLEVDDDNILTDWSEVSCSGPRQVEVSFAAQFEGGAFPGDDYLAGEAADTCAAAFENYVGIPEEQSVYRLDWIVPTENTWTSGDRQGTCLVVSEDGAALSGTVKGSER